MTGVGAGAERLATGRADLGLGAVAAATLVLEILQTRIFSYSLDPLTIHLAVGVCLLGLGASAIVLALLPTPAPARTLGLAGAWAAAGAASVPLVHALFARLAPAVDARAPLGLAALIALALPYFAFGMATTLLLVARAGAIGRAYASNLAGACAGCLLVFPLVNRLGAEGALGVVGWLSLAAAAVLAWPKRAATRLALAAVAAGLVAAQLSARSLFDFPPDPQGQVAAVEKRAARLAARNPRARASLVNRWSRWTETGRVDVWELRSNLGRLQPSIDRPLDVLFFAQDASAGSHLLGVEQDLSRARSFFERTIYGAGYARGGVSDVLVIGVGGSPDVLTAAWYGAPRVVAVDINGGVFELARGPFRELLGDPYARPGVRSVRMDGRTFLRSSREQFDLVQLSGVDTKTVLSSGSLSLSENYLYTHEAMREALARLRPQGALAIARFSDFEVHRLASVAVHALRESGASEPERHLFAIRQGLWRTLLVKRTPFDADEITRLHAWVGTVAEPPPVRIPELDLIGVGLAEPMSVEYSPAPRPVATTDYFQALARGEVDAFVADAEADLRPPSDDRPYFFMRNRPERILEKMPEVLSELVQYAAWISAVAALCILAPLVVFQRRGLRLPGATSALVYFICLGVGFMAVEIGLFHRFVLLLGHQSYAVTVVLFGLLLGASLGSALSSRLAGRRRVQLALAALVGAILVYGTALDAVFARAAAAPFAARLGLSLALLVLLGLGLGIPFPAGLRALGARGAPLVAWAIGVNGFASVIGATLAVPVALLSGLRFLLLAGAALYALALLVLPTRDEEAAWAAGDSNPEPSG